jgi:hypothetical protein
MDNKKITRAADHKFMPATMTDIFLEKTLGVQDAARSRGSDTYRCGSGGRSGRGQLAIEHAPAGGRLQGSPTAAGRDTLPPCPT